MEDAREGYSASRGIRINCSHQHSRDQESRQNLSEWYIDILGTANEIFAYIESVRIGSETSSAPLDSDHERHGPSNNTSKPNLSNYEAKRQKSDFRRKINIQ